MACPGFGYFSAPCGACRNNNLTFLATTGSRHAADKPIMDTRYLFAPHTSDPTSLRTEMDNRAEAPTPQPVQRPAPRSMSGHALPMLSWSSSDRRGPHTRPESRHAYGMTWHQTVQVGSAHRPTSPMTSTPVRRAELPSDASPSGVATRTAPAGLGNATRARSYTFRPNPQDAALLQDLSARLAAYFAYCDSQQGVNLRKKKDITHHVRNLQGLSGWLIEQPEQSLTNVLTRLEAGHLSDLDQKQLFTRYQANPVGGHNAPNDASSIGASVRWLRKLRVWECEQALDSIDLPGVAKHPVPAEIDTQVKQELIAYWLATQSSTQTDKKVLQQASHLSPKDKVALRSLARWFSKAYDQTDKLDCIAKNAKPDMIDLIIEHYKSSASKSYKEKINASIKRLISGEKIVFNRNLDAQLHTDDKLAIDIIKQHPFDKATITAFKQLAIWERDHPQPVGLAQIIANPAYQAHSDRLLKAFDNDNNILPDYKIRAKRDIPKAQESDELKQALSKLLP
ncbi:hypothetical protein SAMN04487769_0335 [Burkholderia sp. b14]|nr:hypothetical protein SAMN04487769_0335 [Burkholderia sp. b14]